MSAVKQVLTFTIIALASGAIAQAGGNDPIVLPPIGPDPLAPRTVVTPILHTGDPAPGIPDATVTFLLAPQIDGEGKVLVRALFVTEGDPFSRLGVWYGHPGELELIAYEGMQAPDLPGGVVYWFILEARLSENGWIGVTSFLEGPGIIPEVNDMANFAGPPGDVRKMLQGDDPAPDLEPGTVIDVSSGFGLTAWLSDNATLLVIAYLSGPDVDDTNDEAIWIGPRDALQLIWRKGMHAPGTPADAGFEFQDSIDFNDVSEIAFRGFLFHDDDIGFLNDGGSWTGPPGALQLVAREGEQAWGLPDGVLYDGNGDAPGFNAFGEVAFWMLLRGEGVTSENNHGLWLSTFDGMQLLGREGDPMSDVGPNIELDTIGSPQLNASQEILYRVKYAGEEIDDSNAWAMYFGPYDNPQQALRDGDPAPYFEEGTVLSNIFTVPPLVAMNDVGDIIAPTEIIGDDVSDDDKVVLWMRDRVRGDWFPLVRAGALIDERVLSIPISASLSGAYWNRTGGSDGAGQSFSDEALLAIKLEFTDGTHGIFLLQLDWPGDADGDADVDFADFRYLQSCFAAFELLLDPVCESFDFDEDQDVDLADYEVFLEATTGPR